MLLPSGKWGEAPASRVSRWDGPRTLSLGQGAGRKKRIRGTKAFLARERRAHSGLALPCFWPRTAVGLASRGSAPWTLQRPGFPGNTPPSFSSVARADLGSPGVRAAGHCFLSAGRLFSRLWLKRLGSHGRPATQPHGGPVPGHAHARDCFLHIPPAPSALQFGDEPSREMPEDSPCSTGTWKGRPQSPPFSAPPSFKQDGIFNTHVRDPGRKSKPPSHPSRRPPRAPPSSSVGFPDAMPPSLHLGLWGSF